MQQPFTVSTDAIDEDGKLDPRYTCDLDNSSPELRWDNIPENTVGFAVLAEDIDGDTGPFTHWLIYNIPVNIRHLPVGIPAQESLPNGIRQGTNSFGKLGYSGPCPLIGDRIHRYRFQLFALSQLPSLPSRLKRDQFLNTIQPYVIATATLAGRYQRLIQRAG